MNSSDNNLTPTEVRHPTVDGSTGHRRRQDFEEAGSFPQVNRNDCVNGVRLRSADQTVWNPRLQESDQSDEGIDSGAAKGKRTKIKKSDSGTSVNSTNENDVKITQIGDSIYRNKSLLDNDSSDDDDHCDNDGSENDVTKSKRSMIASVFRKAPSVHRSKRNTSASKETRSLTSASILSTHESLSHKILRHSNTWDDFVRNGARFKTLVEDAMSDVKSSLSLGRDDDKSTRANAKKRLREPNEQHPDEANTSRKRTMRTEIYESGKRAREKTAEALNLQRVRRTVYLLRIDSFL